MTTARILTDVLLKKPELVAVRLRGRSRQKELADRDRSILRAIRAASDPVIPGLPVVDESGRESKLGRPTLFFAHSRTEMSGDDVLKDLDAECALTGSSA